MFKKVLSFGGMLLLAGAAALTTAGPGQARGPGGGHFGGSHFGGGHFGGAHFGGSHFGGHFGAGHFGDHRFGGFHRGFYHGGYLYYPFYGYPYSYGYYPYSYGYNPYPYGYYPDYSSDSGDSSWYPGLDEEYSPGSTAGFTSVSPLPGNSQEPSPSAQADTTAHVTARVPVGADVWINGLKTYSEGPVREFQSPPLTPGQQYTYEFQARWKDDDGREVTQSQQVAVTAGAHARVDFPIPDATGAQAPTTKGR
jgi:uncharacterized protein (TIGR03000 family)